MGLRSDPQADMAENAILGTRYPNEKPQILFGHDGVFPWSRAFSIQAIPSGGVTLAHSDHGEVSPLP